MGFSRQEYWSGLPFPSQGIFLIEPASPALVDRFFTTEPPGKLHPYSHPIIWIVSKTKFIKSSIAKKIKFNEVSKEECIQNYQTRIDILKIVEDNKPMKCYSQQSLVLSFPILSFKKKNLLMQATM